MTNRTKVVLVALTVLVTAAVNLPAQSIFATLTGVVSDPSQAVVPQAKITLKNESSGDQRTTVSNSEGYFTFASVVVGSTYELTVEAPGFLPYKVTGIAISGAEKRHMDIALKVGTTAETVEVSAMVDLVTPVDSGEKSATLTVKQLQDFSVVGRNAAEFIKIMPGFGIANTGTENRQNFTGETFGINGNGDAGSQSPLNNAYAVNGLPGSSLDITADGAHVSDPGCNCATPVNPNTDMISEFKVLTSNFSAENQKGPAVISSVARSGGRDFHGGTYLYARHYSLNANDWLNNRQGRDTKTGEMLAPRPANRYMFPGGNIGGPVLIPGSSFNRKRDKMFFFTGFEYFFQRLDTGLLRATVPTDGMKGGNFSAAELAKLGSITASGGPAQTPNAELFPNGIIPANQIDPGGRAMMNLYPSPNADPNSTGGFNYVKQIVFDQNGWQWMSRVDYNLSDNTKLFVRYNLQKETQRFPVGLWWRNPVQVPYPTPILGKNRSDSVTASLTHVFSPTMTNEFVFGYTYIAFPNVFEDPKKVDRAALGYPYKGLYKNGVTQIPSMTSWGGEMATILNPGGFEVGGPRGLFADKYLPTLSNNLTKVAGTHTLKFGGFYEWIRNNQPASGNTNGVAVFSNWGGNTTGSAYADMLTGRVTQYQEQSFNRLNDISYSTTEFFVQDQWKATRRLTLELGLRATHWQPWQDRLGFGFSIFDPSKYNPNAPSTDYSGFLWNKRDPSVPIGGFPTRAMNWAPRFGMAYDLFGSGKTVIRGGWGRFYFHTAQFTSGLDVSAGVRSFTFPNATTLADIDKTTPGPGDRLGVQAVDSKSDRSPYSDSYSFTVSQRLPWQSLLEVAYVGNQSSDLLNSGGPGNNLNVIPYGAFFRTAGDPNTFNVDEYRPLKGFQDLRLATHNLYSNYNSMQVSWLRTKGRYNINLNYTWGKAMGIVGNYDDITLSNNYGPQPNDRRHLFNAAYSIELGNFVRGNKVAAGLVNGWQLSGITQIQSGVNLTANSGGNFNLDTGGAKLPSGYNISDRTINGTTAIALRPRITCDPGGGLVDLQHVNGACFALPNAPGANGPSVMPALYGPAFMNWDLGLFKNFQMGEARKLQFRFNAYNFLNHPLWSYVSTGTNLRLRFNDQGQMVNPTFGRLTEKQGRRILQFALKYYF